SPRHMIETYFNYTTPSMSPIVPSPFPDDALSKLCAAKAKKMLAMVQPPQGICLVLGSGDGRLVHQLARQSRMKVIGLESDIASVEQSRKALMETGAYGTRMEVLYLKDLDTRQLPTAFANLIVSQRALTGGQPVGSAAEAARLLRPLSPLVLEG